MAEERVQRRLAAILAADVVGSSARAKPAYSAWLKIMASVDSVIGSRLRNGIMNSNV